MYAVIKTGGKQYRVQPGDRIRVEKLDSELGAELQLKEVMLVGGGDTTLVGQPLVKDAVVTVVVTRQTKDKKVIIFKKKRRQGYRRFGTHRQPFTELFISQITAGGKTAKAEEKAVVVDADQVRLEKIMERTVEKKARAEEQVGTGRVKAPVAKKAAKKVVKKKATKKAAKKSPSKRGQKKAAKKAKKTKN